MSQLKARTYRKARVRKKIEGSASRPRLSVFRSLKNISAQLIDDQQGKTLLAVSTLAKDSKAGKEAGNVKGAKAMGLLVAKKAIAQGIKEIVFDRNGFLFHGRVKALADGAREGGLKF